MADLGSNCFLRKSNVENCDSRAEACLEGIKELNPNVKVKIFSEKKLISFEEIKREEFNIVIFTDILDKEFLIKTNKFCRENNIKFIWTGQLGLYGWGFVDFGPNHGITDIDGVDYKELLIENISQDENGMVTLLEANPHSFQSGMKIKFKEVQGMSELNGNTYEIETLIPFDRLKFKILVDTREFGAYERNGKIKRLKETVMMEFKSLGETLDEPLRLEDKFHRMVNPNRRREDRYEEHRLHFILNLLLEYCPKGDLPQLLNEEKSENFWNFYQQKLEELQEEKENWERIQEEEPTENREPSKFRALKERVQETEGFVSPLSSRLLLTEELVKSICLYARTQTTALSSILGGLIAQETIKSTGKYKPLDQWFHCQFYDTLLPRNKITREGMEGSRYSDLIALFGNKALKKIQNAKMFMVGAGAVGCEYLKLFALMGAACGEEDGHLRVTDDDEIEISNLSRQFLFRRKHVKKSKSAVACEVIKEINQDIKITADQSRVNKETEKIYTDQFFDDIDIIFSAVDNVKARQYLDTKAVLHHKYFINCGTKGATCNSEMIVPGVSKTYNDGNKNDQNEEDSVMPCTLRNFPYMLVHTIKWSKDFFLDFFCEKSELLIKLFKETEQLRETLENANEENSPKLGQLLNFLEKILPVVRGENLADLDLNIVQTAMSYFYQFFTKNIEDLINQYPRDCLTEDGNQYWTSPKRFPDIIQFDPEDETHYKFIESFIKICSHMIGYNFNLDEENLRNLIEEAELKEFDIHVEPENERIVSLILFNFSIRTEFLKLN